MLLEEVDQIIKARRIKLEEIKRIADEDDIGPALVAITNKLTANSSAVKIEPAHFEALFQEQLKKYDGYKRLVKEETATQEDLLFAIQVNTLFCMKAVRFFWPQYRADMFSLNFHPLGNKQGLCCLKKE